ncbi:MAG: YegP family protein [Gammaproteobacteria bacterium]|nr:YegP family protein [Gammaproteobacteria bacterium]
MAVFEINKDDKGFRFVLKADSGQVLVNSEIYTSKASAQNGIESIKTNAVNPEQYKISQRQDGKYFFSLKAKNHQPVAHSLQYYNEAAANEGMALMQKIAPEARVIDKA